MKRKLRKSYTLIELLISMGIFAVMMLLLLNFFSKYQDFVSISSTRNELLSDTSVFMSQIEKDLKSAYTHVNVDANGLTTQIIPLNVTAASVKFLSRCRYNASADINDIDSGQGGLSQIEYTLTAEGKIKRAIRDLSDDNLADNNFDLPTPAPSSEEIILSGVSALNFQAFPTREIFLKSNIINADIPPGNFYLKTSTVNGNPIYGILITVTVKDPNPAVIANSSQAKKIQRDIKSFITVQP